MSVQLASKTNAVTVKSETSYHSPPESLSDVSQAGNEDSRGRRQDRDRSTTAKAEGDSGEDRASCANTAGGKQRKRKRSRKGLEKNFPCPQQGCGKSYSRAEHLYRHQLNREFILALIPLRTSNSCRQTPQRRSTFAISLGVSVVLSDKICVLDIARDILHEALTYSEKTIMRRILKIEL